METVSTTGRCIAVVEAVATSQFSDRVRHLASAHLGHWRAEQRAGRLLWRRTYRRVLTYAAGDERDLWNVLHLHCLPDSAEPSPPLRQVFDPGADCCADGAKRAETMSGPMLHGAAGANAPLDRVTAVEYISVPDKHRAEYDSTMRRHCTPAMAEMLRQGHALEFLPLTTQDVLFADPSLPTWSDIHLVGVDAATPPVRFEQLLDRALKTVDPRSGGCAEVFGRIAEIRTKPRWDFCSEVEEIRV
ncbi:hypothetical protein [Spirillospora sp. NPDC048819]|uniref:hypothetical protein n=1 Tax=Spirillospora sp. NPDC048819 TaxID=3155268 RepID=UPI0033FB5479